MSTAETPPFPAKKYQIILADPPWAWMKGQTCITRVVEKEYPTMQPQEIMDLPVADLAAPHCALFLWSMSRVLPLSLRVMEAWGFDYKTVAFVWVKRNKKAPSWFTGMGWFTRQNAEYVLLGMRGAKSLTRSAKNVNQIIDSPIDVHSRKPDEVQHRIEQLFGDAERIELFARTRKPGWDAWGLEAPPEM